MRGSVAIDANLLVLLIVGSAKPSLIDAHKRLKSDYSTIDFELLTLELAQYSEIILLSSVLVESYNLVRQIDGPALRLVQQAFRTLVESCSEASVRAIEAVRRSEFSFLGLTDAAILQLCETSLAGARPTLLTADKALGHRARVLGYDTRLYVKDVGWE